MPPRTRPRRRLVRRTGYCIRCGETVRFDLEQPFCAPHLRSWARFENIDYPEDFCHSCGEEADTSMAKPRCYECWQEGGRG